MKNNNIELGKRYFLRMRPVHSLLFARFGYTSSADPYTWVECKVVENPYFSKIRLQPLLENFGKQEFYRSDFDSLVKNGSIIEKTKENQRVEFVRWMEQLTPTVCIEHSGFIVV